MPYGKGSYGKKVGRPKKKKMGRAINGPNKIRYNASLLGKYISFIRIDNEIQKDRTNIV